MRRFLRLFGQNWRLASAALLTVIVTRLALWLVPFRFLHRWSQRASEKHAPGDLMRRLRIAHAITIASGLVPAASCLTQALAAQWLLHRRGEFVRLCVGARRSRNGIEAHAWLEHDGGILLGQLPDLQHFQPFRQTAVT